MSYPSSYDSYLSNLDSLVFDTPSEIIQSEKDVADELDLWVIMKKKIFYFYFYLLTNHSRVTPNSRLMLNLVLVFMMKRKPSLL
jgi:hypothetical protein